MPLPESPREVSRLLSRAYPDNIGWWRQGIIVARPHICPLERVIDSMRAGQQMIDVGCGMGSLVVLALETGKVEQARGIDTDSRAIKVAQQYRGQRAGQALFEVYRTEDWPQGWFDVVTAVDVLHHVDRREQREFVHRLSGLVAPGGQLILKDISNRPRWKAGLNRCHDIVMANQWVQYVAEHKAAGWLVEEGLAVEQKTRLDRWWYGHYLITARRPT